ncbi:cytochrome c3 family protein [Effusibacillus lacus]|uniref:Nitrate reductase n=1 Tax=Effusibacillus lacus TaxID=1348429 RepID=A0A292YLN8_9BACL|nr:NapC/NirT family cytochrome c [Effusibacillus lacus]TCS66903.1 respiratory nitrite reductase-specific menaquinol--cytochrome-c reductase (NrfH) precursor [Effusibacillus lacus]GAX90858.1 nitrate reductase [Effusibacillus lacus]
MLEKLKKFVKNKYVIGILVVIGLSYFLWDTGMEATSSTSFCTSCHVMNEVGVTKAVSTHSNLACGDCHVPQDNAVRKVMFKAKSGLSHIYNNTFNNDLPFTFVAKAESNKVIQQRCAECHSATVSTINHDKDRDCTSCHRNLPHNNRRIKTDPAFEKALEN